MMRTRLLWLSLGFASASGAIGQLVLKDLWVDRNSLASQLKDKFNSLETRVSNLESAVSSKPAPSQGEGNTG